MSYSSSSRPSTSRQVYTLAPETAEGRRQRLYAQAQAIYGHTGKQKKRPKTKHELDVLKEHHQFLRDGDVDRAKLSWEEQLSLKYYNSLFREFAVVNLKHYKSGQIALRWRTEDEVLSGVAHLTCASLRCEHHKPTSEGAERFEEDPETESPLVDVELEEFEVPFGYEERGERKEALVKVVLCREDGRRLLYGRKKGKEKKEGSKAQEERERGKDEDGGRESRSRRSDREGRSLSSRRRSASPHRSSR